MPYLRGGWLVKNIVKLYTWLIHFKGEKENHYLLYMQCHLLTMMEYFHVLIVDGGRGAGSDQAQMQWQNLVGVQVYIWFLQQLFFLECNWYILIDPFIQHFALIREVCVIIPQA